MAGSLGGPLDVLAVFAHPDDAELLCGGALIRSADRGERVGVVDLSRGESGTWGSADARGREAERAAEIMGLTVRRTANLADAAIVNDGETLEIDYPKSVVSNPATGASAELRRFPPLIEEIFSAGGLPEYAYQRYVRETTTRRA